MHLNISMLCTAQPVKAYRPSQMFIVCFCNVSMFGFYGLSFVRQSQLKRLGSRSAQSVGVGLHSSLPRPVSVFVGQ